MRCAQLFHSQKSRNKLRPSVFVHSGAKFIHMFKSVIEYRTGQQTCMLDVTKPCLSRATSQTDRKCRSRRRLLHADKCNDRAKFIEMNQNFLSINSYRCCRIRCQPGSSASSANVGASFTASGAALHRKGRRASAIY